MVYMYQFILKMHNNYIILSKVPIKVANVCGNIIFLSRAFKVNGVSSIEIDTTSCTPNVVNMLPLLSERFSTECILHIDKWPRTNTR